MSKLSFRARALDASKPMPIYLAEELPDLPDYSAINRAVPQMPSGMEKEEESEHHLQRAISGTGLIIPTPEVCQVTDLVFYERCYPPDYKMPKQHIHMQPLWEEQEAPEYDMDSEDERWLKQQRHPDLTELVFEQMMDKLEKCSGQTVVTLSEAKLLLERHDDLVIAVYDYWLNKRLTTQHALILSVRTESRPGQPANNPYLAFRRRTEKMQTRKNRKNDESSYEKMLKLRRDLARALSLLQLVARRERAKRDLVRLTHALAAARYRAGDFLPDPPRPQAPPRPLNQDQVPARAVYAAVSASAGANALRREALAVQYGQRAPPVVDHTDRQPRPREKRPYKRKKHRHHALGTIPPPHRTECGDGVTSSEEELAGDTPASPPDPGPFAFRRKPGCYYEMPTSTLSGEPLPADRATDRVLYEHEIDERHRYTLTSLSVPVGVCIGFARRRVGRGGRVLLDRLATPLDDLWPSLPSKPLQHTDAQEELESKAHRTPKEVCRDYHSSGRHPWRHAFRSHLARKPHLWLADVKPDVGTVKLDADDIKMDVDDIKLDEKVELPQDSDISLRTMDEVKCDTIPAGPMGPSEVDSAVRDNLNSVIRKRSWSACSDSSNDCDSEDSLYPVEKEFEGFINEVSSKWLHFRPKTPPPNTEEPEQVDEALTPQDPFAVELRALGCELPTDCLQPFTTSDLTLGELFPEVADTNMDLTTGLSTATTAESGKGEKMEADVDTDAFLSQGQGLSGRARPGRGACGSSSVCVRADRTPPVPRPRPPTPPPPPPPPAPALPPPTAPAPAQRPHKQVDKSPSPKKPPTVKDDSKREREKLERARAEKERQDKEKERQQREKERRADWPAPSPVPNSKIIVEEVNEVPQQIKLEKKKSGDTIEEVVLAHGVQLKTVQTKHSPLKKHIITSGAMRRAVTDTTQVATGSVVSVGQDAPQPQLLTVAVSDHLKVRIQNHIVSSGHSGHSALNVGSVGGTVVGLVGNGPFAAVSAPTQHQTTSTVASVATVGSGIGNIVHAAHARRVAGVGGAVTSRGPLVQLAGGVGVASVSQPQLGTHAPQVLPASHTIHHVAPNKLKVLHAHPLTHTQRNQLLAQNRSITQLPAVVSLATLGEAKTSNTALLKAAPGSVTQFFEIKGTQFGKGPHLVNVVRHPGGVAPKATVARLDLNDPKKRQVVATLDGTQLKGNIQAVSRPHRVNVSVEARGVVRAAPNQTVAVRAHHLRHQIQLKGRALIPPTASSTVRAAPLSTAGLDPAQPSKQPSIPSSVVANLLHKNVQLPKGGQKIAISSGVNVGGVSMGGVSVGGVSVGGVNVGGSVQAIAFSTAQLKARQARLIQPRHHPPPHHEIVEAVAGTSSAGSAGGGGGAGGAGGGGAAPAGEEGGDGAVRRNDTLPMEVT